MHVGLDVIRFMAFKGHMANDDFDKFKVLHLFVSIFVNISRIVNRCYDCRFHVIRDIAVIFIVVIIIITFIALLENEPLVFFFIKGCAEYVFPCTYHVQ